MRSVPKTIRSFSSKIPDASKTQIPSPAKEQLRAHYISNALPMIGFGLVDQTVMIQAGNAIDCTLGVTFGLSTLSAAAVGGLVSNVSGILCGGTLESLAKAAGLPSSNLTAGQRSIPFVKRNRIFSQALGILLGCTIGLLNLLFIDVERSSTLKLQQLTEEHEFAFEVEAINSLDSTTFIVRGPDDDGILADMTVALTMRGCSIIAVAARKLEDGSIEDKFTVVDKRTKTRLEDDDLAEVSKLLLTSIGESPHLLKAQFEDQNKVLQARVRHLEDELFRRRLTIRPTKKG